MDFTEAYGHAGIDTVSFSPGSTFIASDVVVRVSGTLQILQALTWSPDGLFLLASGYKDDGVSYILPMDPDASVTDGSDDNQGWVARLAGGIAGVDRAQWVPVWRVPSVMQFSAHTGGMLYSLADQSFTSFPQTVQPKLFALPQSEYFSVVQREHDDVLCVYSPESLDCPTVTEPNVWCLRKSIRLHTHECSGVAWSPEGDTVAVWDSLLEYRLALYTFEGTHLATYVIEGGHSIPHILTAVNADKARLILADRPQTAQRARRIPVRSHKHLESTSLSSSASRRASGSNDAKFAGGALGISRVVWHPAGTFLAVGSYHGVVHVLCSDDWSCAYTIDLRPSSLARSSATTAIWREPKRWLEGTQGHGIVSLQCEFLPFDSAAIIDRDPLKQGISWMAWNTDGSALAIRNDSMPNSVFVYNFEGFTEKRVDAVLSLAAILEYSNPVSAIAWRPGVHNTLAVVTGQDSVYLFSNSGESKQSAEAIAIPNENFHASRLIWSPSGESLMLVDHNSYCCVIPAQSS
ncbi:hypothetical protein MYAM1_001283 [Malassezia yamatoensis]|uniref:WD repeat-containing protein WRAP73 n=1 Tax=Malassezia yamatoensis TaxID=253288 RepID=A0AAJ5YQD2_9BASI|nr:hypothetical protein MYAM1_001283 [Malassezia yamatoensis]